ncbi:histidine kinase N-terminal 7TM domain-containing protein [Methanolinea mesophila]|uniref:histidine kinase N-terminal 7TM domain-containing protein n=1 Tax=Methanolinea mesophila TaxID=547055 RepID=UPI003158BC8B
MATAVLAVLTVIAWQYRHLKEGRAVILYLGAATLWAGAYAGEVASPEFALNYLFVVLAYIGVVTVPVAWFMFVLVYTGKGKRVNTSTVIALFVVPLLTLTLVVTNQYHHLFYSSATAVVTTSGITWVYSYGPLFLIHALYSYGLIVAGIALLASRYPGSPALFRLQIVLLIIAVGVPFLANLLRVFKAGPVTGFDTTPVIFILTGVILITAITRLRLFSLSPVAYSYLFNHMTDGVFVTNEQDLVVNINPAAAGMLGIQTKDAIGRSVQDLIPGLSHEFLGCKAEIRTECEIALPRKESGELYEVSCMPLSPGREITSGRLVILHNINARHRAQTALLMANQKLNLLNDVTRHDMLNTLTALLMNLEYARTLEGDKKISGILTDAEKSARILQEQVEFTRDYQDMGVREPAWQDLGEALRRALAGISPGSVRIESGVNGVFIYADPLLEKVLHNLVENALKYGERLTFVRVRYSTGPEGLTWYVEDDGVGISPDLKETIFRRGFGRGSGLGLFLAREILSITGMQIRETGTFGKGARFEIAVPEGSFRIAGISE